MNSTSASILFPGRNFKYVVTPSSTAEKSLSREKAGMSALRSRALALADATRSCSCTMPVSRNGLNKTRLYYSRTEVSGTLGPCLFVIRGIWIGLPSTSSAWTNNMSNMSPLRKFHNTSTQSRADSVARRMY